MAISTKFLQSQIERAVEQVGTAAVFTETKQGAYDPTTGKTASATKYTYKAKTSPPLAWDVFHKNASGSEKDGISVVVLPAQTAFTPKVGMEVTVGGATWKVTRCKAHSYQDKIVAYELELING